MTTSDEMGRVKEREDQQGDTCTYTRDLAGRVTSRAYQGHSSEPLSGQSPTDTFTYDKASRMLTAVSGKYSNTVTFTYDDAGRLTIEALTFSGKTYTVTRTYNTASQLTKLTYPDDTEVDRTYTDRGRLEQVDYETKLPITHWHVGGRSISTSAASPTGCAMEQKGKNKCDGENPYASPAAKQYTGVRVLSGKKSAVGKIFPF